MARQDARGKVSKDIVELGGGQLPKDFKFGGRGLAPQLRGEMGTPREWAFVQLGAGWFVREQGWKMGPAGGPFDMSDAPFEPAQVAPGADAEVREARARLTAVRAEPNPFGGKTVCVDGTSDEEEEE